MPKRHPTFSPNFLITAVATLALAAPLLMAAPAIAQAPAGEEPPPCIKQFIVLRTDAEKRAGAIRAASERKADAKTACGLFNSFSAAEAKVVKYAVDNNVWCGIPPQAVEQMKKNHDQTLKIRAQVCKAAAAPPRPAGPTLGEALGATPVPDASNVKRGHGTFDTLTGSPLGR